MTAGHKRGHLFVPHLNKIKAVAGSVESANQAIDAVARIPKNPLYAPGGQALPEKVAHRFGHESPLHALRFGRAANIALVSVP
jgi:hypothetical protein